MANKLTEVDAQTSLEYHVEAKVEVLLVQKEEAFASKLTYTITEAKNDTIAYTMPKVEAEVFVVT